MAACYYGHFGAARLLLERGADPNTVRARDGSTVLFMAAQRGYLEIVKLLLWGVENYVEPVEEDPEDEEAHQKHSHKHSFFNSLGSPTKQHQHSNNQHEHAPGSPKSPLAMGSPNSAQLALASPTSPTSPQFGAHVARHDVAEAEFTMTPRTPRVDVNVATKTANCTPLIMAAQNGHLNIVKQRREHEELQQQ